MKTVMTRITRDVVMYKDTVTTCKAVDRFANCYNLAGRLMTKPA
jgi:hypothetical protein